MSVLPGMFKISFFLEFISTGAWLPDWQGSQIDSF